MGSEQTVVVLAHRRREASGLARFAHVPSRRHQNRYQQAPRPSHRHSRRRSRNALGGPTRINHHDVFIPSIFRLFVIIPPIDNVLPRNR